MRRGSKITQAVDALQLSRMVAPRAFIHLATMRGAARGAIGPDSCCRERSRVRNNFDRLARQTIGGAVSTPGPAVRLSLSMTNEAIKTFESTVVLPALQEICSSPALARAYAAQVVTSRPHPEPPVEELIDTLANTLRRQAGPSLVLSIKERPEGLLPIGGHYVMTVLYEEDDGMVFASPGVMFWMRFNNKLHAFNHRYDNDTAYLPVEDVTREHILNHVLTSFDFYKINVFSEQPFPGYRR